MALFSCPLALNQSAEDICLMQLLCKLDAQQSKIDSLLCTAILGCSAGLGLILGLRPQVILACFEQPQKCKCFGGYLLLVLPSLLISPWSGAESGILIHGTW